MKNKKILTGIIFSIPAIISFFLFKYYPIFKTILISLYDYNMMEPPGEFVGIQNYITVMTNSLVLKSWSNTITIFALGLLLGFWIVIVQAIMLDQINKGKAVYRLLFFIPAGIPVISNLLVWKLIYNPDYGVLNGILEKIGLPTSKWLSDIGMSKISLALPGLLGGGGLGLLYGGALSIFIYLAAIQSIPGELYEAADIDGAGIWQKTSYILLPHLKPIIMVQLILALSIGFRYFDPVFILTGGGPADATRTLALTIYNYAFKLYQMGHATSLSILLFTAVSILTIIRFYAIKD